MYLSSWLMILRLQLGLNRPRNVQLCVSLCLIILLFCELIDHCVATLRGVILFPNMRGMMVGSRGMTRWRLTSFVNTLFFCLLVQICGCHITT